LEVSELNFNERGSTLRWLNAELDTAQALKSAEQLFEAIKTAGAAFSQHRALRPLRFDASEPG
jgi:hypothetical protein